MNMENNNLFEFAAFDELESEHIAAPRYSYWKSVWRTFFKNKFTVAVAVFLIFIISFALIQPTRSGYSPIITPNINNADMKFLKPCAGHIFGTDHVTQFHYHQLYLHGYQHARRHSDRRSVGLFQENG